VSFVTAWFRAFLVTSAVELAVAVPLLGRPRSTGRRIFAVLLAQLASHPSVWFIWPAFGFSRPVYLGLAESFAVLIEFALYRLVFPEIASTRALAISALSNGASLALGSFLRW